ncbi:MAG TPA: hypothetical protein PLG59_10415 [bacterium]|nr:hypothetical protein [bacterium]HQO35067.1 hypothetical protein [bacterium]HQP98903.1 hypothetical protein [bacterium]
MGWFRKKRTNSDEELLAQQNPLLKPGEWEELLLSRRSLSHRHLVWTSREYRKDIKFIVFGAVVGAIVVGLVCMMVMGIYVWRIDGYSSSRGFSMIDGPDRPVRPILESAAYAGVVTGFCIFLFRRFWRRRR